MIDANQVLMYKLSGDSKTKIEEFNLNYKETYKHNSSTCVKFKSFNQAIIAKRLFTNKGFDVILTEDSTLEISCC